MIPIIVLVFLLTVGAAIRRSMRNSNAVFEGNKAADLLKSDPTKASQLLSKLVHQCWYVNMDQIPQWSTVIRNMPQAFRIGGFANVNHWQIHGNDELLMVVVLEKQVLTGTLVPRNSRVPEKIQHIFHVRPNVGTGKYEMRVTSPDGQEEKNLMATFGRKFFEALIDRQDQADSTTADLK